MLQHAVVFCSLAEQRAGNGPGHQVTRTRHKPSALTGRSPPDTLRPCAFLHIPFARQITFFPGFRDNKLKESLSEWHLAVCDGDKQEWASFKCGF